MWLRRVISRLTKSPDRTAMEFGFPTTLKGGESGFRIENFELLRVLFRV